MEPGKAGWVDYSSQPWERKRFSKASEAQRGLSKCSGHVSVKVWHKESYMDPVLFCTVCHLVKDVNCRTDL